MSKPVVEEVPQLATLKKPCQDVTKGDSLVIGNAACPVVQVYRVRIDVLWAEKTHGPRDKPHEDKVVLCYKLGPDSEVVTNTKCDYGRTVDVLDESVARPDQ